MISSTPNVNVGQIIALPCFGADAITVGGTTVTPSASITYRVISCDEKGNVVGCTGPLTLLSGLTPDWGPAPLAIHLGVPDVDREPSMHLIADMAYILIDAVVGVWTISAECQWLPGVTQPF